MALAINFSVPNPGSEETIHLEPDNHNSNFVGKEEKRKAVCEAEVVLAKVTDIETLGPKDLNWVASKLSGLKNPTSFSVENVCDDSNKSQNQNSTQTQQLDHTSPLERNLDPDPLEDYKLKCSWLSEVRDVDYNLSQNSHLTNSDQEARNPSTPKTKKAKTHISRDLFERIRYLTNQKPVQYNLAAICIKYNIPYELVRHIISSNTEPEIKMEIDVHKSDLRKQRRLEYLKSLDKGFNSQPAKMTDPIVARPSPQNLQQDSTPQPQILPRSGLRGPKRSLHLNLFEKDTTKTNSVAK